MSTILNSSGIVFPDSTTQTTGSSQLTRISSNIPVFNMQYSGGSDYAISNATQTKMILNTNNFDSHGGVDTTNYQYTIPINGYYRINYGASLHGYYSVTSSLYGMIYYDMNLRVNGTNVEDGGVYYMTSGSYGMGFIGQSASILLYLNSGQILTLYAQGNVFTSGSGIAVQSSFLSGHLVN